MPNITRRDLMKLAGGSILGFLFTPVPWKLLDDTAIWTQNWSLTPKLPRGPIAFRHTNCPLCPAGCGVKVRTVSGMPTTLSGAAGHLCPAGLAGHHVAFNRLRLQGPSRFTQKGPDGFLQRVDLDAVLKEMNGAIAGRKEGELVAILDLRPGRSISDLYAQFASALPGGVLLDPPNSESGTVDKIAELLGKSPEDFGIDYEHARMILSFGAPLFEGWGTFGRMQSLLRRSAAEGPRIIQVEPSRSETARHASPWLPISPGSESALAFGLANILLSENLISPEVRRSANDLPEFQKLVAGFTPGHVSGLTGIPAPQIVEVARILARETPAVAIAGANAAGGPLGQTSQRAIALLNLLLGAVGREGGILKRRMASSAPRRSINSIPDRSIRLLILDGAESGNDFPWKMIAPKLTLDGNVVSFSPAASGLALHADAIIPSPAPYESMEEIPTPWDSPTASFAVAAQLLPTNPGSTEPRTVILKLAENAGLTLKTPATSADAIRQAIAAIHGSKRGSVFSPEKQSAIRVSELSTPEELNALLEAGGVWTDEPLAQSAPRSFSLSSVIPSQPTPVGKGDLLVEIYGVKGEIHAGHSSPVMTKIYQESGLRDGAGVARLNPETAAAWNLKDGSTATIRTANGSVNGSVNGSANGSATCTLRTDPSINPKIIRVALGPLPVGEGHVRDESGAFALCDIDQNQGWRYTPATLEKGE